jgi:serine/threonine-protein kinase HipA
VVRDEAFFLSVARDAGLPVARADVVQDRTGRDGLLVLRFDRVPEPDGTVRSLAVEDGTQVLGRYPADKYLVTAEQVVTALADLCPARAVALRALFGQVCFAWLTGNGDAHGKNFSVLMTPEGEWRVSPAYDLPSTLPYLDLDSRMALPMLGESDLSRRRLLGFASAIGLPERSARRVLDDLLDATADLEDRIVAANLPFPPRAISALLRGVRDRRRRTLPG